MNEPDAMWCCEKGEAASVPMCQECAETSAAYLRAMSPARDLSECYECDDLGWVWEYGIEEQWKVPCPRWCDAALKREKEQK